MRRFWLWVPLLLAGCGKEEAPAPAPTASAPAAAAPAFDVEGFCETTMAVGRPCEGDDEIMEGNQIGLCTTTLRAARDEGVKLSIDAGKACRDAVKASKRPLPDVRTLETLAQRFEPCRTFAKGIEALSNVKAVSLGEAKADALCEAGTDCAPGLYCAEGKGKKLCTPRKKAGESCRRSSECIGRCSRKEGSTCVAFCGAGG